MFDWISFFRHYNIEYVETGPNVKRGNVNIRCPFCGFNDPSHHMGVHLRSNAWGCWRQRSHRGRNAAKLVQALLNCSYDQARRIVGDSTFIPQDFLEQVQSSLDPLPQHSSEPLELPDEFKPFCDLPSAARFVKHLVNRGYRRKRVWQFTKRYNLRYCTKGAFKGRIIFPVYYQGELVTWMGRTIYPSVKARYKALSVDEEVAEREGYPVAVGATGDYLLWYDQLIKTSCDTIALAEGPFDSLKITELGRLKGICSTCFFTAEPTLTQIDLLHELLPRFKYRYLLLDKGTLPKALQITSKLVGLNVEVKQLPAGVGDPDELDKSTFGKIFI